MSGRVAAGAIGAIAAGLMLGGAMIALSGCDDKQKEPAPKVYASRVECYAEHDHDDCDDAFASAEKDHIAAAPQYNALDSCEAEYGPGNCYVRPGATNSWIPFMAGVMVGNALSGPGYAYTPVYVRHGYFYGGSGTVIGTYGGPAYVHGVTSFHSTTVIVNSSKFQQAATPAPTSRGSWGSTAARSSFSSSSPSATSSTFGSTSSRGGFGSIGGAHAAGAGE